MCKPLLQFLHPTRPLTMLYAFIDGYCVYRTTPYPHLTLVIYCSRLSGKSTIVELPE